MVRGLQILCVAVGLVCVPIAARAQIQSDCLSDDELNHLVRGYVDLRNFVQDEINKDKERWYDGFHLASNPDHDDSDPESEPYYILNKRYDKPNTVYTTWADQYAVQPKTELIPDSPTVLYINGINTSPATHHGTLQFVADAMCRPVVGVLNASGKSSRLGVLEDVAQTALDRSAELADGGDELTVTAPLNKATATGKWAVVQRVLDNYERQLAGGERQAIPIVCHSQGGAICNRMLGEARNILENMRKQLLEKNPGLTVADVPLDLRDVQYTGLANAAAGASLLGVTSNPWPDGPGMYDGKGFYEHYMHVKDPTPMWLGLGNGRRDDLARAGYGARVIRIAGEPKSGTYWPQIQRAIAALRDKTEKARPLWASRQPVSVASIMKAAGVNVDTARAIKGGFDADASIPFTEDELIELVRYENVDLTRAHIADPNLYEVEPGKDWIKNRLENPTDGAKYTVYHNQPFTLLKYWVQRNGLCGQNRPANNHPIWANAETWSFLKEAKFVGSWSRPVRDAKEAAADDVADLTLALGEYDEANDIVKVKVPLYLLTEPERDSRRKTYLGGVPVGFSGLRSEEAMYEIPVIDLVSGDDGVRRGTFQGESTRIQIELQADGHVTVRRNSDRFTGQMLTPGV